MAGIAALFTREFFETARARSRPDGVISYCQKPEPCCNGMAQG